MDEIEEIQIDFDKLPEHIGIVRTGVPGKRRLYDIEDVGEVISWMYELLPAGRKVDVMIIGSMPPWMAMSVEHFLDECVGVVAVRYLYPNMPIYNVFDKSCPELMV